MKYVLEPVKIDGYCLGLYKKMKNWMKMRKEERIKQVKRDKSKFFMIIFKI